MYQPPSQGQVSQPPQREVVEKDITVCKNYVVHELEQEEGAQRPLWKSTMSAMFGDHVNWEDLKVYTAKGRPPNNGT